MATARPARLSGRWAIALALLAGCTADPGTTDVTAAGSAASNQIRVQTPGVATPTPLYVVTPTPQPTYTPVMPWATPVAASPAASPSGSPSPSPSPSASPSRSPSPASLGPGYTRTNVNTDLAVSGPAYFVYSTKPNPAVLADLLFSHDGHLGVTRDDSASPALFRMRHAADALYVVGISGPTGSLPDELSVNTGTALATPWAGQTIAFANLAFDADRNSTTGSGLNFDFTGSASISGSPPRASNDSTIASYVALAQFSDPTALTAVPGFPGIYRLQNTTSVTLGIAASGAGRTLGSQNLIVPGALAQGD